MKIFKIQNFITILFFIFMAISTGLFGNTTLKLEDKTKDYTNFNIEYLKEKSDKTLTINEVKIMQFDGIQDNAFAFGHLSKPIWFKFKVINDSINSKEIILEVSEMFHKTVDLYIVSEVNIYEKNGLSVPIEKRKIKEMNPSFSLLFNPKETKEIFIKIESNYSVFGKIKVKSPIEYDSDTELMKNMFMFYFGAIMLIALYNLVIFFYLKDKVYVYYVGYVLAFSLWALLYRGIILRYIDMETFDLLQITLPIFFIMLILFSQTILEVKDNLPRINKIFNIFIAIFILNTIWILISLQTGFYFMNVMVGLLIPLLFTTAIILVNQGHKTAIIYLFALLTYFIGIGMLNLISLGLITYTVFTSNAVLLGSFIEIILFSLLLAYKINLLKQEKHMSQKKFLIQRDTESIRLTSMVEEKTKELNLLNNKLEDELLKKEALETVLREQASTDFLTGILNRRAFFDACAYEVKVSKRYDKPLSFIIIDIDYFKEINDTYGHLNGDIVLMDLVEIIKNTIRITDIFGRIGGEEFAVLMQETNMQDAMKLSERIRENVSQHTSFLESKSVNITVSIGVSSLLLEDSSIQAVLRRADLALFKAKELGRNQLFSSSEL